MDAEGRSIEEIARVLDSEPDTVRGWIARTRGSSASDPADDE
jgi:DNA-directed RNA polymerase specialized sigma24 family protein